MILKNLISKFTKIKRIDYELKTIALFWPIVKLS